MDTQAWISSIIILTLIISNISIYRTQRRTIKELRDRNTDLANVNNSIKTITEAQDTHLNTYKKMVNVDEIEKIYEKKIEHATNEAIAFTVKKNEELTEEVLNSQLSKFLQEHFRFLLKFITSMNMGKAEREKLINLWFPLQNEFLKDALSDVLDKENTQKHPPL